jgi:hypothetical protein
MIADVNRRCHKLEPSLRPSELILSVYGDFSPGMPYRRCNLVIELAWASAWFLTSLHVLGERKDG